MCAAGAPHHGTQRFAQLLRLPLANLVCMHSPDQVELTDTQEGHLYVNQNSVGCWRGLCLLCRQAQCRGPGDGWALQRAFTQQCAGTTSHSSRSQPAQLIACECPVGRCAGLPRQAADVNNEFEPKQASTAELAGTLTVKTPRCHSVSCKLRHGASLRSV